MNAIQVLNGNNNAIKELSATDLLFMEEGAQDQDAFVFIPSQFTVASSGAKSFVDKNGEMVAAPITGIVIDSVITRGYWPEKDGNKIPFCSSTGGTFGAVNPAFTKNDFEAATMTRVPHPYIKLYTESRPLPDAFACATCTMNQWGSAHQSGATANGKGCLEKRRILFLPDGWHMPIIINLPTMSVKGWDNYCSGVRSKFGLPFFAFRVTLEIEQRKSSKNQPYGEVVPKLGSKIVDMEVAGAIKAAREQFRELLRKLEVEADFTEQGSNGHANVDPSTGEILDGEAAKDIPF